MESVLVMGAGKIGALIACLLSDSGDYQVSIADVQFDGDDIQRVGNLPNLTRVHLDVQDSKAVDTFLKEKPMKAVISSLPYFCNGAVAEAAKRHQLHYFDLTEDVKITQEVAELAKNAKSAFVPQCGLAPGYISIVANDLMRHFDSLSQVKLRVGALPINASNALQYTLTWSTDGLINEYGNPCMAIELGRAVELPPLGALEQIEIDGLSYEAFNTSGGLGSLAETYAGNVVNLNYKTIRYPGHRDKIHFLMNDLGLNQDRDTLKMILERAVPKTYQDVVLIYVSVTGEQGGQLLEENYVKKVYPKEIAGQQWSAIQVTTASGICAALDVVLQNESQYQGFVRQEQFPFSAIIANRFGSHYQ